MASKTYLSNDTGNSERFADAYEGQLIFDQLKQKWMIFTGTIWKPDSSGEAMRYAMSLMKQCYSNVTSKDAKRWFDRSQSHARLKATLSLATSQPNIKTEGLEWNKYPMLLPCLNGAIDLEKGKSIKITPKHLISMQASAKYDEKATAPRWERFIEEIWPDADVRDYIWRAVGYSLTGMNKQQCYFALYGDGSNGKSTFFYIMNRMLGDYGHTMKFTALEHSKRGGMSNDIVEISGKRFVVASETNDRVYLNEGLIKSLTGGDDIVARQLYERNIVFRPEMKLWLAFNHKPLVADQSPGFWRRTRLIEMTGRWSINGGIDGLPLPDGDLEDALLGEIEGILTWAVRGCLEYQKRGLSVPEKVQKATDQYQAENHPLYDFIESGYERDEYSWTLREDVYQSYLKYCRTYHVTPKKQSDFNKLMQSLHFEKRDSTKLRLRVWKGLKPNENGTEATGTFPVTIN